MARSRFLRAVGPRGVAVTPNLVCPLRQGFETGGNYATTDDLTVRKIFARPMRELAMAGASLANTARTSKWARDRAIGLSLVMPKCLRSGEPAATRTPDLYRVKVAL